MDNAYDVTDSSDWLNTPVAPLRSVEAALRCQVCKDFYNTPMITTCCHTFCSLCIRRCLTSEGKCPSCRCSDQEIRLRRNWAVQELVDTFQTARPSILRLGQDLLKARAHDRPNTPKRKRVASETGDDHTVEVSHRTTRSQSRKPPKLQAQASFGIDERTTIEDAEDAEFEPGTVSGSLHAYTTDCVLDDGLSACPICSRRMRVEDVFLHLDTHNEGQTQIESKKPAPSFGRSVNGSLCYLSGDSVRHGNNVV